MDKRIIHMVGAGRYRMAITKTGRLGALRVGCSNSMVSYITNHSFFLLFAGGGAQNRQATSGVNAGATNYMVSHKEWDTGSACAKLSSSNLFIKPLKILQKGDCFMGEYLAPVENELASVTLADLNTDINRVLDLAGNAGANAAIHNQRVNAKLINTLYNLARNNIQDQEAAIIAVNMIVSEYTKNWLRNYGTFDATSLKESGTILFGSQTFGFGGFLATNDSISPYAISVFLYDLIATINSYDSSTDDFYLGTKEKDSWNNSNMYKLFSVFDHYHDLCAGKDVPGSYLRQEIDKLLSTVEWNDSDMKAIAMKAILRYWDIYSQQYDPTIIAAMIVADCKESIDEERDSSLLSAASMRNLPSEYIRLIKNEAYAKVSCALRSDADLDPKLTATQIMQAVYCILNTVKPDDEGGMVIDIINHSIIATLYDMRKECNDADSMKFIDDVLSTFEDNDSHSMGEILSSDQMDELKNCDYDTYLKLCAGLDPDKDLGDDIEELPATEVSYQKSGSSIQKIDVRAGYKLVQDNVVKFNEQAGKMLKALKEFVLGTANMDYVVIEGKKFTFFGLVKKLIGGVALFSWSKIGAVCVLIVRWVAKSKASKQSKRKMLFLLNEEIEIVTEKIDDARSAGDNKAKYALMRSKKELENARDRIKYNLGAEVKSKTVDDLVKRANGQPTDGRDRMGRYVEGHKKGSRM